MTVDEELNLLDDNLRRLKIEYDVYFGGGSKRPPQDLEWRVQSLLKKYGDSKRLKYAQRFRYNAMAQRYAIFSDLWRQKLKVKEEGYRRPQDALLAIQGLRAEQQHAAERALEGRTAEENSRATFALEQADAEKVRPLFSALKQARQKANIADTASFESFQSFVQKKTEEIQKKFGCKSVEFEVEMQNGEVKLKARPKTA
ncbi:MAG TPA: MXAN_5187 C-terminal domain-containing protein [Terriglobales bacterium]|nr:MXAN_5187 C-terminal domain-containing protein [Terriglobales bacterium]